MACERYRDALTDVAAGAVAPADVEEHLASCEGCRRKLAALQKALALADAGLAALVAAEPTPDLPARIREAVAESGPTPAWRFGWLWPLAAAAATLLVALAVWVGRAPAPEPRVALEGEGRVVPRDAGPAAPAGSAIPAGPRRADTDVRVRSDEAVTARHRPRPARAAAAAPEVLVPRGEAEALLRFAAIVHRDRHAPGAFLAADRPSPDLAEPAALDITPLEIVPLDPAETSGT